MSFRSLRKRNIQGLWTGLRSGLLPLWVAALALGAASPTPGTWGGAWSASQQLDCAGSYAQAARASGSFAWSREERERALGVMLEGSQKVSRTVAHGRRFLAPDSVADADVHVIAERNFEEAARHVVENFETLPLNLETARFLNRMLTRGLVPEADRGNYLFRPVSGYSHVTDAFVGGKPDRFYAWLESGDALELRRRDPVAFAETLHHNLAAMDSFPDGNGRLSRLFADLALLRSGEPPAFYTDMKDYFARGNARSTVSREAKLEYYREIVERGRAAVRSGEGLRRAERAPPVPPAEIAQ